MQQTNDCEEMGTGWSQDENEDSQSRTRAESSYGQSQYKEERSKEGKLSETKSKIMEKAADAMPHVKAEQKSADAELGVAKSKEEAEVKLPNNCEAILRDADSLIDRSSIDKLYDQLCRGVFLNQKRKKYWVEKKSNSNCFMLFAKDLSVTWGEDTRYWHWSLLYETSDVSVDVAQLLNVCWLEIFGKFNTKMLSPGILYEVVFVIKLADPAYGWEVPVNVSLVLPNACKQEHKEKLQTKLREQWIEIPVGEFITSQENIGEIQIGMYEYDGGEWKRGLIIKGIAIRPKT